MPVENEDFMRLPSNFYGRVNNLKSSTMALNAYIKKLRRTSFDAQLLKHIKLGENYAALSMLRGQNYCRMTDKNGVTLLHYAALYGNNEFAQLLIDSGANVNAQNLIGETPLMLAVGSSHEEMVRLLLKANADVLMPDGHSESVLKKMYHMSGMMNNIKRAFADKVTPEFLENSLYIKGSTFHKNYPLYQFIPLRNAALTRLLLERGSPVDARDHYNRTALHVAVEEMDVENVRLLVEFHADVNAKDEGGDRPLNCISNFECRLEALEIVKILIDGGVMLIDQKSSEIVAKAILSKGHKELIRLLIKNMDLHFVDKDSMTSLHYILKNRKPGVFEELQSFRFNVNNYCGNDESTLLHRAAMLGNPDAVRFLLRRGANVNAKDSNNCTPLCTVIDPQVTYRTGFNEYYWEGRLSCIEELFEFGADPEILTEDNRQHVPVFTYPASDVIVKLVKPILNLLALREASGQEFGEFMRKEIEKRPEFQTILDLNRRELEEMKRIKIDETVNLFDFLVDDQVALYAQSRDLVLGLTSAMKECDSDSYYHRRLRQRFLKLGRLIAVNEIFIKYYNVSVIHIAGKIVDYI